MVPIYVCGRNGRSHVDKEAQNIDGTETIKRNVFYASGSFREVLIFYKGSEDKQDSMDNYRKSDTFSGSDSDQEGRLFQRNPKDEWVNRRLEGNGTYVFTKKLKQVERHCTVVNRGRR